MLVGMPGAPGGRPLSPKSEVNPAVPVPELVVPLLNEGLVVSLLDPEVVVELLDIESVVIFDAEVLESSSWTGGMDAVPDAEVVVFVTDRVVSQER